MQYDIFTLFDITRTGTTRNFNPSIMPFTDMAGVNICDHSSWQKSRNQQRNWDTLLQLLGLRMQIETFTDPVVIHADISTYGFGEGIGKIWHVTCTFNYDNPFLLEDCLNVPMITGLNESAVIAPHHFSTSNISIRKKAF